MTAKIFSLFRSQIRYLMPILAGSPFRRIRNLIWRSIGYQIGKDVNIMPSANIVCGLVSIGCESYIGDDVMITGGQVKIGRRCDVAPRVVIHAGSHHIGDNYRRAGNVYCGNIVIGDGCWICLGAIILAGAKIGSGVIVAAGSVVIAGEYPSDTMIAGNPAKVIKHLA